MQLLIATIGNYEFGIPQQWAPRANEASDAYFESDDGEVGMYASYIALASPKQSAQAMSDYLQEVHKGVFIDEPESTWAVTDTQCEDCGETFRSVVDLYDRAANYRVLTVVVCTALDAVQISVHHYWCEDPAATRDQFSAIISSVRRC